jgi:hydroxymethylbilane synthase
MRARRNFGNDAAIGAVGALLPGKPVRQDTPVARNHRGSRFVAAGFDAEDEGGLARHAGGASTSGDMTASFPKIRLGTRGSPLALAQAHMTRAALLAAHGWTEDDVEIVTITTDGDVIQDRPLAELGGKALWTKTLDRALIEGRTDASVHSMKDVETLRPEGILLVAMLERADVRDRLIGADSIDALRQGAVIGTASPRRAAQLRRLRPDLRIVSFRGNVATRITRVENGEADATMLAAAGLDRLGHPNVGAAVDIDVMLPAVAQGAVGLECRADDRVTQGYLAAIDHAPTHSCVAAERGLLAALGGSCHSPVGVLARLDAGHIHLRAEILTEDGSQHRRGSKSFEPGDTQGPGQLAVELLDGASPELAALFTCAS